MGSSLTRFDRIVRSLKNNRWIAIGLVVAIAVAGIATFFSSVQSIFAFLHSGSEGKASQNIDASLRVAYIDLHDRAIDFLIAGKALGSLDDILNRGHAISNTRVREYLLTLYHQYAGRAAGPGDLVRESGYNLDVWIHRAPGRDTGYSVDSQTPSPSTDGLLDWAFKRPAMPATTGSIENPLTQNALQEILSEIEANARDWHSVIGAEGEVRFWRYARTEDLEKFPSNDTRFYSAIAQGSLPPELMILSLGAQFLPCSDEGEVVLSLHPRFVVLRVAVVENVSATPVRLGAFHVRTHDSLQIRTEEEDRNRLAQSPLAEKSLYPEQVLKPNEQIVVPIALLLSYSDYSNPPENTPIYTELGGDLPASARNREFTGPLRLIPKNLSDIDRDIGRMEPVRVEQLVEKTGELSPEIKYDFVFGPSMTIESVQVNGSAFPFRQRDPESITIKNDYARGCCPYVLTYSQARSAWETEGEILRNLRGKSRETRDSRDLVNFDGRVIIEERKSSEIAFVNELFAVVNRADGSAEVLKPDDPVLEERDDRYVVLRKGERKMVAFPSYQAHAGDRIKLVSAGYFEIVP